MNKILAAAVAALLAGSAAGQSVDLDAATSTPPRIVYDDVQGGAWNIGFDIYPRTTDEGAESSCQNGNGIPYGIYLADNYQSGNWLQIALVDDRVCVVNGYTWPVQFVHGNEFVYANQWNRVDVTCSAGTLTIEVNGVPQSVSTGGCAQGPGDVHVGAEVGNYDVARYQPFDGFVDNVVVNSQTDDFAAPPYTGTLANGAVIDPFDAGGSPPPPPPPPPPPIDCDPADGTVDPSCICSAP